jgi:hypothetical protein
VKKLIGLAAIIATLTSCSEESYYPNVSDSNVNEKFNGVEIRTPAEYSNFYVVCVGHNGVYLTDSGSNIAVIKDDGNCVNGVESLLRVVK